MKKLSAVVSLITMGLTMAAFHPAQAQQAIAIRCEQPGSAMVQRYMLATDKVGTQRVFANYGSWKEHCVPKVTLDEVERHNVVRRMELKGGRYVCELDKSVIRRKDGKGQPQEFGAVRYDVDFTALTAKVSWSAGGQQRVQDLVCKRESQP